MNSLLPDPVKRYYQNLGIDLSQYDFSAEPELLTPEPTYAGKLTAFAEAKRYELSLIELRSLLRNSPNAIEVVYSEVTKPGQIARRLATLNSQLINRVYTFKGDNPPVIAGLTRYIDLTAKGWRSFYFSRVSSWRETNIPLNVISMPPITN